MTIDNIKEEIEKANKIAILTHENPDGDAIGSSLAFYLGLKKLGKNADVIIPSIPRTFKFLPGANDIKSETKNKYDLVVVLDCGDIGRISKQIEYFENTENRISIDHHETNTMFADYNFVNPTASSCAQILISLFQSLEIKIDKEIGTCLLAGIITDTGGFKYQGVSAETFEFVAELLNSGVEVSDIYRKVLQIVTKQKFELIKIAMNRIEFLENDRIAFTYITKEDEKDIQVDEYDGIVELGRDVEGVEISIFLREIDESFKISLRSNEYVNVSDIGLLFNGGGHIRAAGGMINATLEEAKERIIAECKRHLK